MRPRIHRARRANHAALAAIVIGFGAALSWPALADPYPIGGAITAPADHAGVWTDVSSAHDLPTEARLAFPRAELVRDPGGPALLIHDGLR